MDWVRPEVLFLLPLLVAVVWWSQRRSGHGMGAARRRAWLLTRSLLLAVALVILADPAIERESLDEAAIIIVDQSESVGSQGLRVAVEQANGLLRTWPERIPVGVLSVGAVTRVVRTTGTDRSPITVDQLSSKDNGHDTDLAGAIELARGLFPAGTKRRIVVLSDGLETRGDARLAAREARLDGITVDVRPVHSDVRPDVRVVRVRSSRARSHEGATVSLTAEIESSLGGSGQVRLYENGIEVEKRELTLSSGDRKSLEFNRTPENRNLYRYRVRVDGFADDTIAGNNEGMAIVEVRGRPLFLHVAGDPEESHHFIEAMSKEGIRLVTRSHTTIPSTIEELAVFDGVILSDVAARHLSDITMSQISDYVEQLGGGLLMIGGTQSFGVGGYYRTPIEEVLPVKLRPPDQEEQYSSALVLVIDRSGSMSGQKIEVCKSAAKAAVEILNKSDHVGVVVFDSAATWVVPMMRANQKAEIAGRLATINAGGGTNIYPGMTTGFEALDRISARVKHMIVLTDGQTRGGGYEQLAADMYRKKITVSTVGVGAGADLGLLQRIAKAGGGSFYSTLDATAIPKIFTQDTAAHAGKLIREEPFAAQLVEDHPMLAGWDVTQAPPLLGYVKTIGRPTAQVPLVSDIGDPVLAHWRYGIGKATAFTSDAKSRWAALWIAGWPGYSQFWGQVLRETARSPQGYGMDIRLVEDGHDLRVEVDLLADPAHFQNSADVEGEVYFVPSSALGSTLKNLEAVTFLQSGPGQYRARYRPEKAGVYLFRARSGSDLVSAGYVYERSSESAVGRVDHELLEDLARITGGRKGDAEWIPLEGRGQVALMELSPVLLKLLLLLGIVDLLLRRWENVLGVRDAFAGGRS